MSLFSRFQEKISDIFNVPIDSIQYDEGIIRVGSSELPLIGVFFKSSSSTIQLIDYFKQYEEDTVTDGKIFSKTENEETLNIKGLSIFNQNIDAGVYQITGTDDEKIVVFTGSFADMGGEPDLTSFPEVLLAIAVLDKIGRTNSISWVSLLEGLGPFVVFSSKHPFLFTSLAECGLSARRQNTFSFTWSSNLPSTLQAMSSEVPEEAQKAYLAALQESATADVAFLRLYRVLEILFAGTYKEDVAKADLGRVIALIQSFQSISELDTLRKLVERSTSHFSRFTKTDFNILFSNHRPGGNYLKISKWLDETTIEASENPQPRIYAFIIYYVRCALVHSKMNEREPFLISPFSIDQERALENLVEDTRDIIRDLLFR
jgi:hypothetical protein